MTTAIVGMVGMVIGALAILVLMVITKAVMKRNKKEKAAGTPVEVAPEDRQRLLNNAGKAVSFTITDDIFGETTALNVDWVDAYGIRYNSFEELLESRDLTTEEAEAIEETAAILAVVRTDMMKEKRFLQVKDMLDGKVYIYEPCKMKLDVDAGPARIAIELVRNADLSMSLQTIMVSKMDVTIAAHRYEFDMLNMDDAESFELLVRDNAEYKKEMELLATIESRIAHYNGLVARDRVAMENGQINIFPPSPEEIKAMVKKEEPKKASLKETLKTASDIKAAIEEFVSSSSL